MIAKKNENIITIEFEEHRHIVAPALFQHNTGQVIKFNDVPDGAEVQFSNENSEKTTNKIVKDSQVEIPDFLVAEGLEITAYIQYVNETSETTIKIISIPVEARVQQGEVVAPEDEQTFREELQGIMNETKEAAKEAADKVEVNRKCIDEMEKKSTDTIENITTVGEAQINAINEVSKGKLSDINQTATSQIDALNRTAQAQIESINNVAKQNIETGTNSIVQETQNQIGGINQVVRSQITGINQVASGQINAINDTASRQISAINDTSTSQINAINQTAQAQSKALQEQGDALKYDLAVKEKHTIMLSAGAYSDLIDVGEYDAIQVNGISCNKTDTISESLKLEVVKFKDGEQVGDEFLEKYNAIADLTDCDSIKLLVAYRGGTSDVATVWYTLIVWDAKKEIERYVERVEDAVLIKPTASGKGIVINDSSDLSIQELHLFGKTTQNGTPTPDVPIEIKQIENPTVSVAGKNLLIPTIPNYSSNATITIQDRVENKIKIKINKLSTTNTTYIIASIPITRMIKKIKPNTKYTIILKNSSNITHTFIGLADGGNRITNTVKLTDNRVVLTTISDINNYSTKYPLIFYFTGSAIENAIIGFDDIAVYEGEYPNAEIEEYKEIQTAQLTYELNGIGDVRDELIVRADGTGKLIQNIIRMNSIQPVTAGLYTKDTTKSNTDLVYFYVKNSKKAAAKTFAKIQAFSPKFAWASTNIWQLDTPYVFDVYSLEGSSNIRVLLRINKDDDIDELLKTGIDILYALKEPIVTDLTAEEVQKVLALHTYKPNSTIWNDQDAEMEVTYVADAKNYIDNKFKELSDAIVASASEAE